MVMTRASGASILTPVEVAELLVTPAFQESVAAQVSTQVSTSASSFRLPTVTADPTAAWVAEGNEITPSDMTLAQTDVLFYKLAGLSIITRELANDSSPEATEQVGLGLARDIARKIDVAYFANTTANGPNGLGSITPSTVVAGAVPFSVDHFVDSLAAAASVNATIDTFVLSVADFVAMSKLKQTTTSSVPLLSNDPTKPTGRVLLGVPIKTTPALPTGTAWAIPRDRTYVVVREDADVETDSSVFFTSDRVAVKATMRVGFGYPHPAACVKLTHT
jgi:HK97 family phage major capsid protein